MFSGRGLFLMATYLFYVAQLLYVCAHVRVRVCACASDGFQNIIS
jgi:hypothetical protein